MKVRTLKIRRLDDPRNIKVIELSDSRNWEMTLHPIIDVGFRPHPRLDGEMFLPSLKEELYRSKGVELEVEQPNFHNHNSGPWSEELEALHSCPAVFSPFKYFDYKSQTLQERLVWTCPINLHMDERVKYGIPLVEPDLNTKFIMPCEVLKLKLGLNLGSHSEYSCARGKCNDFSSSEDETGNSSDEE
jgi:hypothetical protein